MAFMFPEKGSCQWTIIGAFSKTIRVKFTDYEITRHELEEADELCHGNWIEIQHLREYIRRSQSMG